MAELATYHQQSVASTVMLITTSARSRRRILLVRSGADDTVAGQVKVRELAVLTLDFELHRPADGTA